MFVLFPLFNEKIELIAVQQYVIIHSDRADLPLADQTMDFTDRYFQIVGRFLNIQIHNNTLHKTHFIHFTPNLENSGEIFCPISAGD